MEYRAEELLKGLEKQRATVIESLCSLNENLPNYGLKCSELNNQIMNIDNQITSTLLALKDIKIIELNNELSIKTQLK